jgi:hypothetical protein
MVLLWLADDLERDAKRLVQGLRPRVSREEGSPMLPGGRGDEGVVDGPARDAQQSKVLAKVDRLVLAEERRNRKVVGKEACRISG